jgi:DNA polymerase-3 subunit delta
VATTALAFLKAGSKAQSKPIGVVFGDDLYLKRSVLDRLITAALGTDTDEGAVARFAGESATLADVLDELHLLPFFGSRRIALVENADPFVTAHRQELEAYAAAPSGAGALILNVKTWTSTTKLAKLVEGMGVAVDCKSPRRSDLPAFLIRLADDGHGVALEQEAAALMVELVGDEVGLLAAELGKLVVAVGSIKRIARGDVIRMVGAGRVEQIWQALDAATTGRAEEALCGLDRLLAAGENPVGLLAAIATSLKKVHHAGQLRLDRLSLRDACVAAGIPDWPGAIEKTGKQHAHLGPDRVDRLPEWLLRADLDLKGGSMLEPRTILERLFIKLAQPRPN